MFAYLVLSWLLLSIPFAVLVGKCISFGQAGVVWPDPADATAGTATGGPLSRSDVSADDAGSELGSDLPQLPAQRRPLQPARQLT